ITIAYPVGSIGKDYDAVGNIIQLRNVGIGLGDITDRTYDALNRVITETINYGLFTKTIFYTYDPVGNIIELIDPDGLNIIYNYNGVNQLIDATGPYAGITDMLYDPLGNNIQTDLPNGEWNSSNYDNIYRLTDKTTRDPLNSVIFMYDYTYNAIGQILNVNKNGLLEANYNYNTVNWLTNAVYPSAGQNIQYSYDPVGNRITQDDNGNITSFTYNTENRVLTQTFPNLATIVYTYDNNGNVVQTSSIWGVVSYDYDYENRLEMITYPPPYGYTANYFSPEGKRLARDERGQITHYFPTLAGNIVEMDAFGNTSTRLNPGISQAKDVPKDNETKITEITYCHWAGENSTTYFTGQSITASFEFDYFGGMLNYSGDVDGVDPGLYASGNKVDWDPMLGAELIGIDYAPDIDQCFGNSYFAPIDHFEPGSEPFDDLVYSIYRNDRKEQDNSPGEDIFGHMLDTVRSPWWPECMPWWCSLKELPEGELPGYMIGTTQIHYGFSDNDKISLFDFKPGEDDQPVGKTKEKCPYKYNGKWVKTNKSRITEGLKLIRTKRAKCKKCRKYTTWRLYEVTYQKQIQKERTVWKCTLWKGHKGDHHCAGQREKEKKWFNDGKPYTKREWRLGCGCVVKK
ncbi:MAG: hypothetical protein K8R58_01290, partial [Bacteroidales bacterium]|nr:hypothetical protein [Bacteroidales bacterium]